MNRVSGTILLLICTLSGFSQNCEKQLDNAQRAYYNGNLKLVISTLSSCITKDQLDADDKEDAFRLMINAYLVLNQDSMADVHMAQLLKDFPLFRVKSTDLVQFKVLHESYVVRPKFNVGINLGFNMPDYEIMQYRSYASFREEPKDYDGSIAPTLGISGEYALLKNLYAGVSILYQNHKLSFSETLLDLQKLKVKENMHHLHVPMVLKYVVGFKPFRVFINGGINTQILLSSRADLSIVELDRDFPPPIFGNSRQFERYKLSNQRNRINFSYTLGIGFGRQFRFTALEVGASYDYGLNNLVKEQKRYSDDFLLTQYSYVSDDFKMNHFRVMVSIYRTMFKARKK